MKPGLRTAPLRRTIAATVLVACAACAPAPASAPAIQESIRRVEQMPNIPRPLKIRHWKAVARRFDALAFDFDATGEHFPVIWWDRARRNFDQDCFGMASYLGHGRAGAKKDPENHEGIVALGAVLGATLAGIDKSNQQGRNYVAMCRSYFNRETGLNIVANRTRTNVGEILQLDCLATDFFRPPAYPTYLYYNPHKAPRSVQINVGRRRVDLYDAAGKAFLRKGVTGRASFTIRPDSAVVLVLAPAGGRITRTGSQLRINGTVIDYAARQR